MPVFSSTSLPLLLLLCNNCLVQTSAGPTWPVTTRRNLGYSNDGCDHGAQAASGVEQVLVPHPCGSHDYLEFFDRGSVLELFFVTGGLVMNLIPVGPRFLTGGVRYPVYPCIINSF